MQYQWVIREQVELLLPNLKRFLAVNTLGPTHRLPGALFLIPLGYLVEGPVKDIAQGYLETDG